MVSWFSFRFSMYWLSVQVFISIGSVYDSSVGKMMLSMTKSKISTCYTYIIIILVVTSFRL